MAFSRLLTPRTVIANARANLPRISSFYVRHKSDHGSTNEKHELINHSRTRGIDILRNPKLNKGTAFTLKERQLMCIHGLVPPTVRTMKEQTLRVLTNFYNCSTDLDKFIYLMGLQDRNEKLFYKVLSNNVEKMMPIVYTPTVGLACQKYGILFRRPRGVFVSFWDKGHIYDILCNWPESNVKAIVVTDGERILGLGDLGAYGMGIPVGKLSLYTALGGIQPSMCLPVLLDVGTNNTKLHEDPLYIGMNRPRIQGPEYDEFMDEFLQAVVRRYGSECLIQFEDFGNHNAFRFLEKYRNKYCMFNDDIQGTAAVGAAGVFSSLRLTGRTLCDNTFLFQGAGEASIGIASLLCLAMEEEGISQQEACERIWLVDSKGLITNGRPSGGVSSQKTYFAKDYKHMTNLEEIVDELRPSVIIGAAAVPGAFTERVIKSMAQYNERPVIFALSNPTSKAECTAEQAYTWTQGRCVFASGSPFPPFTLDGRTYHPGQGNNAYIFPGVALGVIACGIRHVPDTIFLRAARCLSQLVTDEHMAEGRVYPPLNHIQDVSFRIAVDLAQFVYQNNIASAYPEPTDKEAYVRSFMYDTDYELFVPKMWDWPDH